MNTYQILIDRISEQGFDLALNVAKSKMKYFNNQVTQVDDEYIKTINEETIFWYEKINGQNFINIIN